MVLSSIILTFIQLPVNFLQKNSVLIRHDTSCFQQFCSVSFIFRFIHKNIQMIRDRIFDGLTFDDILLVPGYAEIHPPRFP